MKKRQNYYQRIPVTVRSAAWFTFCNYVQKGTALITVPIFTRLLTTEEYGISNIYFAWFEIFVLFTSLKMPYEGLNNGLIRYENDKDGYTSSIAGEILTLTLAAGGIYLFLYQWIERITGLNAMLMLLMFVQLLFNPMLYLWMNREKFEFHYQLPVIVTLLGTALNLAISIVTAVFTPYKTEARILGTVLVQGLFGMLCCIGLFVRGKKFYSREYWKFGLTFHSPLIFYYLSQFVLNQSDRLMINYFEGSGKAGIYSVAYSAGTLLILFVSAVNSSFHPWLYRKLKEESTMEIGKAVSVICAITALVTALLVLFAPWLIAILATEAYRGALLVIPPVAASVFFMFIYMVLVNIEMYYGATSFVSISSVLAALANLALNAVFIPVFGYVAAGWTTLVCYLLLAGGHYLLIRKVSKNSISIRTMLPGRILGLLSMAMLVFTVLMNGIYIMTD